MTLSSIRIVFFSCCMTVGLSIVAGTPTAQAQAAGKATAPFGPGTLTVIPPETDAQETYLGPIEIEEFSKNPDLAWSAPDFPDNRPFYEAGTRSLQEMAKNVMIRRDIYCLEFAFKPMRQIEVEIPQPDGRMAKKIVWYLVYRLRYQGGDLRPKGETRERGGAAYATLYPQIEGISYEARRCMPLFVLRSENYGKEYLDRVIPSINEKIAQREKIYAKLHNTVELTQVPIPYSKDPQSEGVWGVATWEDVDPRIDFFSVFVYGLTNAMKLTEDDQLQKKVLHLTFYRPGDTIKMLNDKIRFGVPAFRDPKEFAYALKQYGLEERLDYRWVFR